jgi:hypothetical protein
MKPIILSLSILFLAACNNNTTATSNTTQTDDSSQVKSNPNWSSEGATEFVNNCVANAQQSGRFTDEKKAFAFCNCVLNQIKQKYPNLDSAQAMLADTAQMVKLQDNCK